MLDPGIEGFGRRVLGETQDLTTADAGQAAGPGDQQEAQGAHAADDIRVGALPGAGTGRGDGVELKAPGDVVGEDAELLPGAVGAVVSGRDDIERELALEFGDRFLLGAAATDEEAAPCLLSRLSRSLPRGNTRARIDTGFRVVFRRGGLR